MRVRAFLTTVSILAIAATVSLSAQTPAKKAPAAPKLPAAVEAAFKKAYPNAVIKKFSSEKEDGKLQWEIESTNGGANLDVNYLPDGTMVVAEETITAADVPAPVLAALKTRFPKATVSVYEKLTKPSGTSYEMQLKGAAVKEAEIAPDGTFISPKPVVKKH